MTGKNSNLWKQVTELDKRLVETAKKEIKEYGKLDRIPTILTQWSAKS